MAGSANGADGLSSVLAVGAEMGSPAPHHCSHDGMAAVGAGFAAAPVNTQMLPETALSAGRIPVIAHGRAPVKNSLPQHVADGLLQCGNFVCTQGGCRPVGPDPRPVQR